jgi:hypothetical protein
MPYGHATLLVKLLRKRHTIKKPQINTDEDLSVTICGLIQKSWGQFKI